MAAVGGGRSRGRRPGGGCSTPTWSRCSVPAMQIVPWFHYRSHSARWLRRLNGVFRLSDEDAKSAVCPTDVSGMVWWFSPIHGVGHFGTTWRDINNVCDIISLSATMCREQRKQKNTYTYTLHITRDNFISYSMLKWKNHHLIHNKYVADIY